VKMTYENISNIRGRTKHNSPSCHSQLLARFQAVYGLRLDERAPPVCILPGIVEVESSVALDQRLSADSLKRPSQIDGLTEDLGHICTSGRALSILSKLVAC
jgi:hypothetical protein